MNKGNLITDRILEKVKDFFLNICLSNIPVHSSCNASPVNSSCKASSVSDILNNPGGGDLLLAVSGGVDSTVLADAIQKLYPNGKCSFMPPANQWDVELKQSRIGVAHVNFHLRGEDSNRDQEFVLNLAQRYGFEFFTADFDTLAYAKEYKVSVEIAARELRYNWFRELAQKEGFDILLTAHNANDNAETLLLNLVRGTGRQGLGGIRPFGPLGDKLYVARPLLEVERSEIEEYAKDNNLEYCIDKTNSQNEYSRNKIRNQIIPLLQEINPSVVANLSRDIAHFRSYNTEVDRIVMFAINKMICNSDIEFYPVNSLREKFLVCIISLEKLKKERNLEFWLGEIFHFFRMPLSEDVLEGLANCILTYNSKSGASSSKIFKFKDYCAVLERGELRFYTSFFQKENWSALTINGTGAFEYGLYDILVYESQTSGDFKFKDDCGVECSILEESQNGLCVLDLERISFPLTVRKINAGDKFSPFGLKGSKSVADFLNSKKVDLAFKECFPVVTDRDGKIVCLPSLEIDNHFKVTPKTRKVLVLDTSIKRWSFSDCPWKF